MEENPVFRFNRKIIVSLLIIVILLVSVSLGVYLVQNTQIFKSRATGNKPEVSALASLPFSQAVFRQAVFGTDDTLNSLTGSEDDLVTQGYLVEFKEPSVVEYAGRTVGMVGTQSTIDYTEEVLLPKHEEAKKDVLDRLGTGMALGVSSLMPAAEVEPQTGFLLKTEKQVFATGEEIKISVLARSDIENTNLFSAKVKFPTEFLKVASLDLKKDKTFVNYWIEKSFNNQADKNGKGQVSLTGGIVSPGYKTEKTGEWGIMAEIVFATKKEGEVNIDFAEESAIYSNSSNKDILSNKRGVAFKISSSENTSSSIKILGEYTKVFNGIALDISKEDVEKVKDSPFVKVVYPNTQVQALLSDSVPLIGANEVWKMQEDLGNYVDGSGVTIAVIDTGIDYTHSDLGNCTTEQFLNKGCSKVIDGYDFVYGDNNPMDDNGHGTHVAATAGGNGALKGVAPGAKLIGYKVLDSKGGGHISGIIAAIEKSVDPNGDGDFSDHWDVINMSLGSFSIGDPDDPLSLAADRATDAGVTVVVAAGNSGPEEQTIGSPAAARKVISVGAIYKESRLAEFSSRGPVPFKIGSNIEQIKPDVVAPGVLICAARLPHFEPWKFNPVYSLCGGDDKHVLLSGTSMAAPHVAGAAALIKQAHPDWLPYQIKSSLVTTAKDIGEESLAQGSGIVNVLKAVQSNVLISPVSLSLGLVDISTTNWSKAKELLIKNTSQHQINYQLGRETSTSGTAITFSENHFSLTPGQTKIITITLIIDNNLVDEGVYFDEIKIKTDTDIHRLPIFFFKKSPQIILSSNPVSNYFTAKIATPYINSATSPQLLIKAPSGKETTITSFSRYRTYFITDPTLWVVRPVETLETGDYTLTTSLAGYNSTVSLTVDKTPPTFAITETHDENNLNLSVIPNENLSKGYLSNIVYSSNGSYSFQWSPSLYVDNNEVYAVFINVHRNSSDPSYNTIEFVKSTDFGNSWSLPLTLSTTKGENSSYYPLAIAPITKFKDKLYILYLGSMLSANGREITIISSSNQGITWSSPLKITEDSAVEMSTLHLKEYQGKLYAFYPNGKYVSSEDGVSWNAPQQIITVEPGNNLDFVAVDANEEGIKLLYRVFNHDLQMEDFYLKSSQDLVNWTTTKIEMISNVVNKKAFLKVAGSNIFIAWSTRAGGVMFGRSVDNGKSWTIKQNITGLTDMDSITDLGYQDGQIYIMWLRNFLGGNFMKTSDDNGNSWSRETTLDSGSTFWGQLDVSGKTAHFIWPSGGMGRYWIAYANNLQLFAKVIFNNSQQFVNLTKSDNSWVGSVPLSGYGNYTIEVTGADVAGNTGSANTSFIVEGPTPVPWCNTCNADINKDTVVDIGDTSIVSFCMNKKVGDEGWDKCQKADIDNNGEVNKSEFDCINKFFGQRCLSDISPSASLTLELKGDINRDNNIDLLDMSILFSKFGKEGEEAERADIDGNSVVNSADYSLLLQELIKEGIIHSKKDLPINMQL